MQVRGHWRVGTFCYWPQSAMPSPCICLVLGPTGLVASGDIHSQQDIQHTTVCVCMCVVAFLIRRTSALAWSTVILPCCRQKQFP